MRICDDIHDDSDDDDNDRDIEHMTGVRPGWYWQIMWRFVSPALMILVISSSIYFMFTNKPTYIGWDGDQVEEAVRRMSDR